MSWQRIDVNFFIDDTLVTCAEYQLFIDEMREQGKYYQPDHWNSYQFPDGQAREPILGVRYSDALTFCEWLTGRENQEWKYRLSTHIEASQFPLPSISQRTVGYWLIDEQEGEFQFAWFGSIPEDARGIDFQVTLASAFAQSRVHGHERISDKKHDFDIEHEIQRACNRALSRPLYLDIPFFERSETIDNTRDFNHFINDTLDKALQLSIATDRLKDSARSVARIRSLSRRFHLDHLLDLPIAPNFNFDAPLYRNANPIRTLDLYFDTFTLQERIAGRSPAFEGIRLVKERTR